MGTNLPGTKDLDCLLEFQHVALGILTSWHSHECLDTTHFVSKCLGVER